jgi:hypothetical protein
MTDSASWALRPQENRRANRQGVIEIRESDFACKIAMAIVVSGYPRVYRRFRAAGSKFRASRFV